MKKTICISLIACLSFGLVAFATNMTTHNNRTMMIGVEEVEFTNDFYKIENRIYVPIRELSEKLRIPINWNEEKEQVELMVNNRHPPMYLSSENWSTRTN